MLFPTITIFPYIGANSKRHPLRAFRNKQQESSSFLKKRTKKLLLTGVSRRRR
jgi:hypothetical protein